MSSKAPRPKRSRINMRIPLDLLKWAKGYVKSKNTNLTQDYVDYLTRKREEVQKHG